jgi:hypothetical protein
LQWHPYTILHQTSTSIHQVQFATLRKNCTIRHFQNAVVKKAARIDNSSIAANFRSEQQLKAGKQTHFQH